MFPPVDVARFYAGDERLFAELVRAYSPRLAAHLRRYGRTDSDVADLLQEVWLRAFQKRRSFEGRGSLFGWLLTICRTVGFTAIKRMQPDPLADHHAAASTEPAIHARIEYERLLRAVDGLPERQRETVLLRIVEGKSTAEAARALGCAEGTIKASLHAAMHKLQQSLKETV